MPLLLKLQQNGASPKGVLYVYRNGYWEFESAEACNLVKGTLSQSELQQLQGYIDDPGLGVTPADGGCPDSNFEMLTRGRVVCWSSDSTTNHQSDSATAAIAQFLHDRVAQLHWDGSVQDCSKGVPGSLPTRP
jgi:hypothetical protein